jgi:hypothetical protein
LKRKTEYNRGYELAKKGLQEGFETELPEGISKSSVGETVLQNLADRYEKIGPTILESLTLLNKDAKTSELDLCDEMTEELKSEIKLVEGEFEIKWNYLSGHCGAKRD